MKRAIDTNDTNWNDFTVEDAIKKIGEIVSHVSNPLVTDYHIVHRIRSGVSDKTLQIELSNVDISVLRKL